MQKLFFRLTKKLCFSLAVFALAVCSLTANASLSTKAATPSQITHIQSKNSDASKVLSAYRQWAGTRYRLGGTTKAGIDCSAFVKAAMNSAFNLHLPRSTAEQKHSGKAIPKKALRPGDLVFFRKNHHVGIYIGGGKFVHASSSRGVTTSSLSEKYWARTYTQSRRVL
ncbi:peptidase C40 [Pasteurellaceae bacterium Orientalotternb1]|nr:peptidase C40 [Pasteurellaceae bacterium Orientalotternb1]